MGDLWTPTRPGSAPAQLLPYTMEVFAVGERTHMCCSDAPIVVDEAELGGASDAPCPSSEQLWFRAWCSKESFSKARYTCMYAIFWSNQLETGEDKRAQMAFHDPGEAAAWASYLNILCGITGGQRGTQERSYNVFEVTCLNDGRISLFHRPPRSTPSAKHDGEYELSPLHIQHVSDAHIPLTMPANGVDVVVLLRHSPPPILPRTMLRFFAVIPSTGNVLVTASERLCLRFFKCMEEKGYTWTTLSLEDRWFAETPGRGDYRFHRKDGIHCRLVLRVSELTFCNKKKWCEYAKMNCLKMGTVVGNEACGIPDGILLRRDLCEWRPHLLYAAISLRVPAPLAVSTQLTSLLSFVDANISDDTTLIVVAPFITATDMIQNLPTVKRATEFPAEVRPKLKFQHQVVLGSTIDRASLSLLHRFPASECCPPLYSTLVRENDTTRYNRVFTTHPQLITVLYGQENVFAVHEVAAETRGFFPGVPSHLQDTQCTSSFWSCPNAKEQPTYCASTIFFNHQRFTSRKRQRTQKAAE